MTTQAVFVRRVRRKLNELNADRFPDSHIKEWLNEAADDAARRTWCLRAESTVAVIANQQEYSNTPSDLLSLNAVQYTPTANPNAAYPLQYIDRQSLHLLTGTNINSAPGGPGIYWTWGFPPELAVSLYPIPTEAGSITLFYYKTFAPLDTETTADEATDLPFPGGWDSMLINYCVSEALLSDKDSRNTEYRQFYEQALTGLAETATRFVDQGGIITPSGSHVPSYIYDHDYGY